MLLASDYASGTYCILFLSRTASERSKSDMPVIFLSNDSDNDESENCDESNDAQMSSFGFMSFAMALVNAVINNANNVNNNNNNNNNNENNNNNNLGNINIANSNNGVNNMNMVTAGRRRMLNKNIETNHRNISIFNKGDKPSVFIHNLKNTRGNQSTFDMSRQKFGKFKENSKISQPIKTISIGYLESNHTTSNNRTNKTEPQQSFFSKTGMIDRLIEIYEALVQQSTHIITIITNFVAKTHFKSYLDKFSSAFNIWSSIMDTIEKLS